MILLVAVVLGWIAGMARARYWGRQLLVPTLRQVWLVPLAFLPQWLLFYAPMRQGLGDSLVATSLIGSQLLLLLFVWLNRTLPAFWLLGSGVLLNFLVISLNGGLMPVSPETISQLTPTPPPCAQQLRERVCRSKDRLLPVAETRLPWLRDRFILPLSYRVAFSLGDVLIAAGAFWLLWLLGGQGERL